MSRAYGVHLIGKEPELHDLVIVLGPADCHSLSAHLASIAATSPTPHLVLLQQLRGGVTPSHERADRLGDDAERLEVPVGGVKPACARGSVAGTDFRAEIPQK